MTAMRLVFFTTALFLLFAGCTDKKSPGNRLPLLSAGPDARIPQHTQFYFNGLTRDPLLPVEWQQTSGTPVRINNPLSLQADFVAPRVFSEEILTFTLSARDPEAAIPADDMTIQVYPVADLATAEFAFSRMPIKGVPVTIHIVNEADFGYIDWTFTSHLNQDHPDIQLSKDRKSLTFTPERIGDYNLLVTSSLSRVSRQLRFMITPEFPFDPAKITGFDGVTPVDELIGEIVNQSFIVAPTLDETAIMDLLAAYPALTLVGTDPVRGTLVSYDETRVESLHALAKLRQTKGVDTIYQRIHEGVKAARIESFIATTEQAINNWDIPTTGSNWQITDIDAPEAWAISTGNPDIYIGISDGGFNSSHPDLKGRVFEELGASSEALHIDHGNSVAGTIAAIANNGIGIAGINWQSQMVLSLNNFSSLRTLAGYDDIKVISSSWAIPGYIPEHFDPDDPVQMNMRFSEAIKASRPYRALVQNHPDKLFIWSAGNGINNGKGHNDVYGIQGEYHSPALHLSDEGEVSFQDNVLFVAAKNRDNALFFYSNYGNLVEIAAPSHFQSLTRDDYQNFVGTSAATPVVSGVASLVFSMHPGFTGREVKEILLSTAKDTVTQRQKGPGNSGMEPLHHRTPVINAFAAVSLAKDMLDNKFRVNYLFPNPSLPEITMQFLPYQTTSRVESTENRVFYWHNEDWVLHETLFAEGNKATFSLKEPGTAHKVVTAMTLITPTDEKRIQLETPIDQANLLVETRHSETNDRLARVSVDIEPIGDNLSYEPGQTGASGEQLLWLKPGRYRIHTGKSGFQPASRLIEIKQGQSRSLTIHLTPTGTEARGALDGLIIDEEHHPVPSATLRLTGGKPPYDYDKTLRPDPSGYFRFGQIPTRDARGERISYFTLEVSAYGYTKATQQVLVTEGLQRTRNLQLTRTSTAGQYLFADDVEDHPTFEMTGLWQRIDPNATPIANRLINQGFTALPADNAAREAVLPQAHSGQFAFWFGNPEQGNYLNRQVPRDLPGSGGTSETAHAGQLLSPQINLRGVQHPVLSFATWWEIEAMNPGIGHSDQLRILVSTDNGTTFDVLKHLNPQHDPAGQIDDNLPYSSAGFNLEPVWVHETLDLSAYKGEIIRLAFIFDTIDNLHNGFRGWLIDDIIIRELEDQEAENP